MPGTEGHNSPLKQLSTKGKVKQPILNNVKAIPIKIPLAFYLFLLFVPPNSEI